MQLLKAIWDNTYNLLVDDGQLALGALAAVTATGVFSTLAPPATVQAYTGPVLLGWTCLLVVSNLYTAGRHARHLVASPVVHHGTRYGGEAKQGGLWL
jgi:hypothetical protein